MVKSFKYIIKRIIIGTGIAIALMLIKGNLLIGVSAEELITRQPTSIGILADNSYNEYPIISNTGWDGHDVWSPGTQSNDWSGTARLNYNYVGGNYCTQTQNYGTLSGIFYNASTSLNSGTVVKFLYTTTSSEFTCSTNLSSNKGTFSCTGVDFTKNFTLLIYNASPGSYGVVKQLGYTCEASIGSQIENDNQNTQNIINNNNTNTQTIINNNNQNTQSIINNQNENTEKEIESQKVCTLLDRNNITETGRKIDSSGNVISSTSAWGVTDFISLSPTSTLSVLSDYQNANTYYYCFYNINKSVISCNTLGSLVVDTDITIPNNSSYIRFSVNNSNNKPTFKLCRNGNQAIADGQKQLNDTLNDTNGVTDNEIEELFGDFEESNTPISDLLLMPITLYSAFITGISATCSPVSLGSLYDTPITLPCINLEDILGSSLWSLIDLLFSFFMFYNISQLIISAFNNLTSLKDDFNLLFAKHYNQEYQGRHAG